MAANCATYPELNGVRQKRVWVLQQQQQHISQKNTFRKSKLKKKYNENKGYFGHK